MPSAPRNRKSTTCCIAGRNSAAVHCRRAAENQYAGKRCTRSAGLTLGYGEPHCNRLCGGSQRDAKTLQSGSEDIEVRSCEAKAKLSELLRGVKGGNRYTITLHGVPVADLVPPQDSKPSSVSASTICSRLYEHASWC